MQWLALYLLFVPVVYSGLLAWNPQRCSIMTDFAGVVVGMYYRPLLRRLYIFLTPCVGIRVDLRP